MIAFQDKGADRIVPPTGFTATLTVLTAAAMAFVAVLALAVSLAAGRLALDWEAQLAQGASLRISAPQDQMAGQIQTALSILDQTPGVASARALSDVEQRALLAPWFGPDLPVEGLPIPQLIEIIETSDGFDAVGLRLRLAGEVPGAVLDLHERWRAPLRDAAARLRLLGWIVSALLGCAMAGMVTLAAHAALAANGQVIEVLRLVGALDDYIAGAFVRRFTRRGLIGATSGMLVGLAALEIMPDMGAGLTGLQFEGWHWVVPIALPLVAGGLANLATRKAARRVLKGLS